MNKNEKLTEATMLALQGKLNERMKKHIEYNVCADVDSEDVIETFFDKDDAIEFAKNSPRAEIVQAVEVEMDADAGELGDVIPTKIVWSKNNIIQSKLNEVYVKEYIGTFDDLYQSSWGPAKEILQHISDLGLEQECMDWLEDFGTEDAPIDRTELNDYIWNNSEDLYDALGLDENGDPINDDEDELDENKKVEKKSNV